MDHQILIAVLILAPLVGFFINGFRFKSQDYKLAGTIATAAIGISFVSTLLLVSQLISLPADARILRADFFTWMYVGGLNVQAGFVVDVISAVMLLVITGVGTLIHIFSIGYISHDERPTKYFAYLNFFVFNTTF